MPGAARWRAATCSISTPENFDAVMDVNLRGTLFLTQVVGARHARRAEAGHPRSIITITSVSAEMVSPDRAEYCVSKAGAFDGDEGLRHAPRA